MDDRSVRLLNDSVRTLGAIADQLREVRERSTGGRRELPETDYRGALKQFRYRVVLELRKREMPFAEIGKIFGISVAAVHRLHVRAERAEYVEAERQELQKEVGKTPEEVLGALVESLPLSTRLRNALRWEQLGKPIGELCSYSAKDLKKQHGLGNRCVGEIRELLAQRGLALKGENP